ANPQNRQAHFKNRFIDRKSVFIVNRIRAARENDSRSVHIFDFFSCDSMWMKLTINTNFTDAASDQLIVLTSEIQNDDFFLLFQHWTNWQNLHLFYSIQVSK